MATTKKKVSLSNISMLKDALAKKQAETHVEAVAPNDTSKVEEPVLQIDASTVPGAVDAFEIVEPSVKGEVAATPEAPVKKATPVEEGFKSDLVRVKMLPGTKPHGSVMSNGQKRWLITPEWKGRERWFDLTKETYEGKDADGVDIVITTRQKVLGREMGHMIIGNANTAEPLAEEAQPVEAQG